MTAPTLDALPGLDAIPTADGTVDPVFGAALSFFDPAPEQFWAPYPKQERARGLAGEVFELLYGGAAGGGKSAFLRGYACDFAAAHPGAHIAIVRRTLPRLRQTHGLHLPGMLAGKARQNKSEFTWTFPNGSVIRFISLEHAGAEPGTGDEENYKSAEFDVLLFDELTEFEESQYRFMLSRVRSARGHWAHAISTANPEGSGFRWVKRRFVQPRPEDLAEGQPPPTPGIPWRAPIVENGVVTDWQRPRAFLPATVYDNPGLLAGNPGYVDQLRALPTRQRRALLDGDWSAMDAVPGALWGQDSLDETRVASAPDLIRVVIGVDPSGTSAQGDRECGIVVAGRDHAGHVYVLHDASGSLAPDDWASTVASLYSEYAADRVIAEVNYGGEMVESTLRHAEAHLPVKVITASRGKAVRAEPISVLTRRGLIHMVGQHGHLEDQLTTWTPQSKWSPDRLDAFVWAATELFGGASALAFLTSVSAPCPECKTPNVTTRPTCARCGAALPGAATAVAAAVPGGLTAQVPTGTGDTITIGGLVLPSR